MKSPILQRTLRPERGDSSRVTHFWLEEQGLRPRAPDIVTTVSLGELSTDPSTLLCLVPFVIKDGHLCHWVGEESRDSKQSKFPSFAEILSKAHLSEAGNLSLLQVTR